MQANDAELKAISGSSNAQSLRMRADCPREVSRANRGTGVTPLDPCGGRRPGESSAVHAHHAPPRLDGSIGSAATGTQTASAAVTGVQARSSPFVPTQRGGGGKLRLLWWQAPTLLNAHLSNGLKDSDAARVVYEPLAGFNRHGEFVPILAESIPSHANGDLSPDGTAVTWRLKQGVVWHDGVPFTADDVMFTWEYAADPATSAVTIGSYQPIARIDRLGSTR